MKDFTTLFNEASQWAPLPDANILVIKTAEQLMYHFQDREDYRMAYPISTSKNGIGNQENSYMTPAGWHQIVERYGDQLPEGAGFKARRYITQLDQSDFPNQTSDIVLTRILRLAGLEKGLNKGSGIDSYERYIYIHGTVHENELGKPASNGCIRMSNADIVDLFQQLNSKPCLVYIQA